MKASGSVGRPASPLLCRVVGPPGKMAAPEAQAAATARAASGTTCVSRLWPVRWETAPGLHSSLLSHTSYALPVERSRRDRSFAEAVLNALFREWGGRAKSHHQLFSEKVQ